ncbi:MAG: type IV toxin-antitoxin system AbiEi family antitoxin [Planctomycetota bacterium]|nr:type IV toxin-antitoxin system AbiEi family antitoxin [Planctomycetota bacterium]
MTSSPPKFDRLLSQILAEFGAFQVLPVPRGSDPEGDVRVSGPAGLDFRLELKEYKRITPATAESACLTLRQQAHPAGSQPVLFAPVVSDRTSEIATKHGVSWMDYAGNCRLVFPAYGIYVRRSGIENPFGKQLPKVLNVFSYKSSRVVRAMLQEPLRGWQLNELAAHPDVRVSPALLSRIKRSLVESGYAVMQGGQIRLKRPDDLLDDWVNHYRNHKPREYGFYMRGELEHIEQQIALWCSKSTSQFAISRFSAAWRLAPEVRYNVASFIVPTRAMLAEQFIDLSTNYGARKVDSGANLALQISDDESCFSNRLGEPIPTTSPLQTYLDLRAMDGRGEEAAMAIYEKYFKQQFMEATEHYEGN